MPDYEVTVKYGIYKKIPVVADNREDAVLGAVEKAKEFWDDWMLKIGDTSIDGCSCEIESAEEIK